MNISSTSPNTFPARRFGLWGRLPLLLKLLLAFGALFFLAVVIAAVSLYGLNRTTASYEDTLTQGVAIRQSSDLLTFFLTSASQNDKDYLLRWREQGADAAYINYATLFLKNVANMRQTLQTLTPFGSEVASASSGALSPEQYQADLASLAEEIDTYEQSFLAYVDVTKRRGSDENSGLEGAMRTAAHNIETKVSGVAGLEPLEISYLQLRRHEKDYIERNEQSYINQVHATLDQLKIQVAASEALDAASKTALLAQMDAYLKAFDEIVTLDRELLTHDAALSDAALALQTGIAKIETLGETLAADDIAAARANSSRTLIFSVLTVFFVLAVSIVLALGLARQITRPVIQLTGTAQQIAEGNFEAQAEVASADEVGSLAQTFNLMTARLQQAFEEVRRRALAVQTSAEVSRRLSAATNSRQLAAEVVEQLQAAFHYYHAHIYFFDERQENLLMAGGTGEAGASMLASGHSIARGRGLVGRAAETNAPVLVEDVAKAIGWLPNPLLPETKSELAVPVALGKQVLGVIDVQQNRSNGLDENDVALLQSIAGQVAISLQNARAYEQSKAQAELESLVNAIGQKIQRAASVEDTLQTAIREVGLALGAARVSASIGRSNGDDGARNN